MNLLRSILLLSTACMTFASHNDKEYMICKSVASLFESSFNHGLEGSDSDQARLERDQPGAPHDIESVFHGINKRLTSELREIKEQLKCYDGVVVDSICYRLLYRVGVKVTFMQAENLCVFHGGLLLEIPNEKVYNAVTKYVRRTWSIDLAAKARNFVQVFLSSRYESGAATLRNGEAAYIRWHPRYPTSNPNHYRLLISVTLNTHHPPSENGMFNYNPTYTAIPLCQFTLD